MSHEVGRIGALGRALVVGEANETRARIGAHLSTVGFETLYAEDGLDALDAFFRHRPDLVVLNRQISKLNGIGFVRRIRKSSAVPVVMLTESGSISDCEVAMRVGVDRYLQTGPDLDRIGMIARELVHDHVAGDRAGARPDRVDHPLQQPTHLLPFDSCDARWTAAEARSLAKREFRAELERHLFECRGNMAEIARRMGKDRSTIRYHLHRLDLLRPKVGESDPRYARMSRDE